MPKDKFIEEIFEIDFGDNAINKNFSYQEVIDRVREYSDEALKFENFQNSF